MKIKKIIMFLLFLLGSLELLVGIGVGFYPSLIMGSCLLYGAVVLRNRIKTKQKLVAFAFPKECTLPIRDYFMTMGLVLTASIFLYASIMINSFPGIASGTLFGFFAIKRIFDILKKRRNYHDDDSKTIY